jgi:uncharacterized protein
MAIRRDLEPKLLALAKGFPSVTITGPRQSGKTTLCRMAFPSKEYVSLENPDLRDFAMNDPHGFLKTYSAGAILDEVQRAPDLLSYIQTELDRTPAPGRFVLTGSANFHLLQSITQSLAGRTAVVHLLPLGLNEMREFRSAPRDLRGMIVSGGYPAIYDRRVPPEDWYASYVATYVERDVRQILNVGDLSAFQTFLRLCAGRTGQILNLSALGADCGISHATAASWLSVLEASFLIFRLPPFIANINRRLVKAPKIHFHDTGLLCFLLGIRTPEQLAVHPLRGAIFETWVASEVFKARVHAGQPANLYYYRDSKGLEIDLIVDRGDAIIAVESKSGETIATDALVNLERLASLFRSDAAGARARGAAPELVLTYGGDTSQTRTGASVVGWSSIADYGWVAAPGPGRGTAGRKAPAQRKKRPAKQSEHAIPGPPSKARPRAKRKPQAKKTGTTKRD